MPIETTRIVAVLPPVPGWRRWSRLAGREVYGIRHGFVLASGEEVVTYDAAVAERAAACCAERRWVDVVLQPRKQLSALLVGLTPHYHEDEVEPF